MGLRYPHEQRHPGSHEPASATRRSQHRHLRRSLSSRRSPGTPSRRGRRRPRGARRRGRHRRGPRARPARQREPPAAHVVRPLRQPDRRGRVPPVLALADGARRRARPGRGALGVRVAARPRPPGRRLHGVVAHRARPRLPDLDDVRRGPRAARRRRDRQGVDPAARVDDVRPGAASGRRRSAARWPAWA